MEGPGPPSGGNDLGDFLRARRDALDPRRAGLPDDGRLRRVPGLRREELSQLANVSVDYIVRLEQGRARRVSRPVLDALADALQLDPDERAYLDTLAEVAPSTADGGFEDPVISAGQVLRPYLGELPLEHSSRLSDLDQIAIGVAHVAADLRHAVDRLGHELGPLRLPIAVAGVDVSDPQVEEGGDLVRGLIGDDREVRLVRSRSAAGGS